MATDKYDKQIKKAIRDLKSIIKGLEKPLIGNIGTKPPKHT